MLLFTFNFRGTCQGYKIEKKKRFIVGLCNWLVIWVNSILMNTYRTQSDTFLPRHAVINSMF